MQFDIALEPELSADQLVELGLLADQYDIGTMWVTNDPQARDLFMLYARVAQATQRLRLGVMAISPFEIHPVKLSTALQTLNEMSKGRASIIVGGGGAILANTRLDLSRRVRAVRECIDILKRTQAREALHYDGELYPVWNYKTAWAVAPVPRVLAGANADQMMRMSTRQADGIHMSDMPLELLPKAIRKIEASLRDRHRSTSAFEINNFWAFHVKNELRDAQLEARSRLILRGMLKPMYLKPFLRDDEVEFVRANIKSFYKPFHDRPTFYETGGGFDGIPESLVDKMVEHLTLTVSTDDLDNTIEQLKKFSDAGLTHITLGIHDQPADAIRLIGERVIPAFKNKAT